MTGVYSHFFARRHVETAWFTILFHRFQRTLLQVTGRLFLQIGLNYFLSVVQYTFIVRHDTYTVSSRTLSCTICLSVVLQIVVLVFGVTVVG